MISFPLTMKCLHLAQIGLNLRFNFINRAQCRTLLTVLWQQQHFKMSTKYECDKGSRKNGRNPFATSHDCHFMHISSFTQTLRNRVGTLGIPNASFWRGLLEGKLFFSNFFSRFFLFIYLVWDFLTPNLCSGTLSYEK